MIFDQDVFTDRVTISSGYVVQAPSTIIATYKGGTLNGYKVGPASFRANGQIKTIDLLTINSGNGQINTLKAGFKVNGFNSMTAITQIETTARTNSPLTVDIKHVFEVEHEHRPISTGGAGLFIAGGWILLGPVGAGVAICKTMKAC